MCPMQNFIYKDSSYPIRQDLADAYSQYWQQLPRAGNWTIWAKRIAGLLMLGMSAYYVYQAWLVW